MTEAVDAAAAEPHRRPAANVPRTPEVDRRLALLWGPTPDHTRGRRPRFTVNEVVDAGLAVADAEGLAALSMRKVAAHLDVSAMSLYTYVPGRTELVDLMTDRAHGEMSLPTGHEPWRDGLRSYAHAFWELYHTHPWLLEVVNWRHALTPRVLDAQEAGLRTIINTGLPADQIVNLLAIVDNYVQELSRQDIAETRERERTGQDIEAYWESLASFWEDYFEVERYPVMTRIWEAGGFDRVADGFAEPFEHLLEAIAAVVDSATIEDS